jgi:hypothetical protein
MVDKLCVTTRGRSASAVATSGVARLSIGAIVLGIAVVLSLVAAPAALPAQGPHAPAGADRVEQFKPNLDGDRRAERVFVYNLVTEGFPATYFEVWDHRGGTWERGQVTLVTQIPSFDLSSGLRKAWVGDLNRDGRVEIAVRDYVTPSVGETLSIYRQQAEGSRSFKFLQGVPGDQVSVRTRKGKTAILAVFLKSNHSPDNLEHHEIWEWSNQADRWRCDSDCAAT